MAAITKIAYSRTLGYFLEVSVKLTIAQARASISTTARESAQPRLLSTSTSAWLARTSGSFIVSADGLCAMPHALRFKRRKQLEQWESKRSISFRLASHWNDADCTYGPSVASYQSRTLPHSSAVPPACLRSLRLRSSPSASNQPPPYRAAGGNLPTLYR